MSEPLDPIAREILRQEGESVRDMLRDARTIRFSLPWPPALNHYYRTLRRGPLAGRVLISEKGRAYRQQVIWACIRQRVPRARTRQRVRLEIQARVPDARRRDLDGLLKAALDALEHFGLYASDSQIDDLRIYRGHPVVGGALELSLSFVDAYESAPPQGRGARATRRLAAQQVPNETVGQ